MADQQNEWASRLAVPGALAAEFALVFATLDLATRRTQPPPKDGTRCSVCNKKIELETRYRAKCNGLCGVQRRGCGPGASQGHKIIAAWRLSREGKEGGEGGVVDGVGVAPPSPSGSRKSEVVGLGRRAAADESAVFADESEPVEVKKRCARSLESGERCSGIVADDAVGAFCSRRCARAEEGHQALIDKMLEDADKPNEPAHGTETLATRRLGSSSNGAKLGALLVSCEKKKVPEPPKEVKKKERASKEKFPAQPRLYPTPALQPTAVKTLDPPAAAYSYYATAPAAPARVVASPYQPQPPIDTRELFAFVSRVIGEKYWPVFLAEEIEDLETLKLLREADLTDMGIPLGPRKKLFNAFQR